MNETDTEATAPSPDETVGHWLRAAREAAGLGPDAVAEALHLDRATIQAIEDNDFERLGAGVFAKGHIKAYAAHLSLDQADALERYYRTAGHAANALPPLTVSKSVSRSGSSPLPQVLLGVAVVIVLILVVLAVRFVMRDAPEDVAASPQQAAVETTGTADRASPEATVEPPEPATDAGAGSFADRLASAGAAPRTTGTPTAPTREPSAQTAAPVETAAAPAAAGLVLRFSDECWYEVRDANGRRLATGIGQAGQTRTVRSGERPLDVTLGYAEGAEVLVDGEPFEIPATARRGRRAIFSVP